MAITVGYVICGCVEGWCNATKDYKEKKEELTIDQRLNRLRFYLAAPLQQG